MSNAIIPFYRHDPQVDAVRVGKTVRANTWKGIASLHNWVKGRGCTAVPFFVPIFNSTNGSPFTFKFRVALHSQTVELLWVVLVEGDPGDVSLRAPAGAGPVVTTAVSDAIGEATPLIYTHSLSSQGKADQEISIDITTSDTISIVGLACYGMPRKTMVDDSDDRAELLGNFTYGQPIKTTDYMFADANDMSDMGRKASLVQWATPADIATTDKAHEFVTGSAVDLWEAGVYPPILGAQVSGLTASADVRCLAAVDSGTGTLTFTTNAGSVTRTVTATSLTWTTRDSVTIDAEDMDSTDGRQTAASPAWDSFRVEGEISTGTVLYLAAVSVYTV